MFSDRCEISADYRMAHPVHCKEEKKTTEEFFKILYDGGWMNKKNNVHRDTFKGLTID